MRKLEMMTMDMSRGVTEALNTLRTNLFYMDNVRVIALTSSLPGEGKSVLSFALARSFAAMGKRTLYVDCDMRKSRVRSYYNVKSEDQITGLSEFLSGQANELVYDTDIDHLHVILSGKYPPDPAGMLSSKYFAKLMEKLRETYSYIIIDTPPVSAAMDAQVVGRLSDGVVFVVKHNYVKQTLAKHCIDQLERSDVRILGVAMNSVDKDASSYYEGYYGYYY
ncbi:MAG: CpsD/CapB family tyrosine-protein kinase [Erysipelotrichaceae bacterium]|nr:CpsD/CapB family tyrosine-protein kinase [Erysipelotrichaceae bacterium]